MSSFKSVSFVLHLLKKAHNVQVPQLTLKDFKGDVPTFNNCHKRDLLANNGIVGFEKKVMIC